MSEIIETLYEMEGVSKVQNTDNSGYYCLLVSSYRLCYNCYNPSHLSEWLLFRWTPGKRPPSYSGTWTWMETAQSTRRSSSSEDYHQKYWMLHSMYLFAEDVWRIMTLWCFSILEESILTRRRMISQRLADPDHCFIA